MAARGDTLYVLSHQHAPRFRLLAFDVRSGYAAHAHVVVPQSRRVIEGFGLARDAVYLRDLDRGLSRVRRAAYRGSSVAAPADITLPFAGAIGELDTDVRHPGAVLSLQGWTHSPHWFAIASDATITDTTLRAARGRRTG